MQKSLIDAITAPRETVITAGYLLMADDVLLNIGQLSRAANESGCDRIMRSATLHCADVTSSGKKPWIHSVYINETLDFFEQSDERFRAQLTENVGSPSTYCAGTQNDFIYIPTGVAADWARIAQQMTDAGLVFIFAFYSAIFGIARKEDMIVLNSKYLNPPFRATRALAGTRSYLFERMRVSYPDGQYRVQI